ncbi:MAG: DUF2914 domain-containing protein [Halioglobus sp.]
MTDLTSNLTIRIKLTPAEAPRPVPVGKYRWDRIVMVAALALIVAGALVFKLSQTPAQPTALPELVQIPAPPAAAAVPVPVPAEPMVPAKVVNEEVAPAATIPTPIPIPIPIPQQASTIEAAQPRSEPPAAQEAPPRPQIDTGTSPLTHTQTAIVSATVKRLLITDGVNANEPQGDISDIRQRSKVKGLVRIYAYSEVHNLQGETLHYRWLHAGELIADVKIKVRSNSWRSYASKYLNDQMRGNWRVELESSEGELLAYTEFVYH